MSLVAASLTKSAVVGLMPSVEFTPVFFSDGLSHGRRRQQNKRKARSEIFHFGVLSCSFTARLFGNQPVASADVPCWLQSARAHRFDGCRRARRRKRNATQAKPCQLCLLIPRTRARPSLSDAAYMRRQLAR